MAHQDFWSTQFLASFSALIFGVDNQIIPQILTSICPQILTLAAGMLR